jgi:hypothetical protein
MNTIDCYCYCYCYMICLPPSLLRFDYKLICLGRRQLALYHATLKRTRYSFPLRRSCSRVDSSLRLAWIIFPLHWPHLSNLGFVVLGSGIRCESALGLHLEISWPSLLPKLRKERRRVWWALFIHVFDRVASVGYGPPCGGVERGCRCV